MTAVTLWWNRKQLGAAVVSRRRSPLGSMCHVMGDATSDRAALRARRLGEGPCPGRKCKTTIEPSCRVGKREIISAVEIAEL